MSKPEDTRKRFAVEQGFSHEVGIPVSAFVPPGSIEAMERQGQDQLLASTVLPTEVSARDKSFMEKWGFKFGEKADDLFTEVTLPEGWKRESSDHDMWSYIVDAKGRKRVAVFYKAAFYDRRANMRLESRAGYNYEDIGDGKSRFTAIDNQTGEQLGVFEGEYGEASDAHRAFVKERFGDNSDNPEHWTE